MFLPRTDSQLLTPEVFESVPELNLVRCDCCWWGVVWINPITSSEVLDSDKLRLCLKFRRLACSGSVLDFDETNTFCVVCPSLCGISVLTKSHSIQNEKWNKPVHPCCYFLYFQFVHRRSTSWSHCLHSSTRSVRRSLCSCMEELHQTGDELALCGWGSSLLVDKPATEHSGRALYWTILVWIKVWRPRSLMPQDLKH